MSLNICILGAGAWGSAMAIHLNRCRQCVTLFPRRIEHAIELASCRENFVYLPKVEFPRDIQISSDIASSLPNCDVLIFACPSKALRETAQKVAKAKSKYSSNEIEPDARGPKLIISLCKGLEAGTLLTPEEVLREELPGIPLGVLSGPTNAAEVAKALPVAVVFANNAPIELAETIQQKFSNTTFRIYLSTDLMGVELGGALKNIYAIAAGICDGMALGANARASLLTRALAEMSRIIVAFGGKPETVQGLSGMGDLIATATADWSRNRSFGIKIGSTGTLNAINEMSKGSAVVEGYYATKNFYDYIVKNQIDAPILACVYGILYGNQVPANAINELMTRNLKSE